MTYRHFGTVFFLLLLTILQVSAQDEQPTDTVQNRWTKKLETGLNINQAAFSDNWKGGGVTSFALGSLLNGRIDYESERFAWTNDLQLQYGILKNANQSLRKNTDRIFFESKGGYKLSQKWRIVASLTWQTQFSNGFRFETDDMNNEIRTKISQFMAPGYITEALGIEYKPVDYFYINLSPAALRQTFVIDTTIAEAEPTNYGVEPGRIVRNEIAWQLTSEFNKDIAKNLTLYSRLSVFGNYEQLDAPDVRFDISLTAKINSFLSTNLAGTLLYDRDQDENVQFSQALSLGILYKYKK